MPDYQEDLIKAGGVSNVKTDLRLKLAAPGMIGNNYILFKNIYCSTGGNNKETGNKKGEG